MVVMVVLSFVLAYPVFIVAAYLLARMLFPDLQKSAEEQKREREMLYQKAQRVKKVRFERRETARDHSVFRMPVPGKLFSNEVLSNI
jgi:hypothetical protein